MEFRLWSARRYDNHREQILRGSHTDYEDESLDVFPYFTAACYSGFGDDDDGFYAVYAKVFDQIATEDIEFMDSPDEYEQIPKFGTSTSDYETCVGPFYAYWQSYCTKKTYTWLCPHNIQEIRDRRILREVEKETKKIAQKKRKERNDEIRALVAFVRKRDKRVHEYRKLLEARAEQNRQKQQQHRLAQLRKNQQAVLEMQKNQSSAFTMAADHEQQLRQLEQAYGSDSDYTDDDDDDDEDGDGGVENGTAHETENGDESQADAELYYVDDLYCVACNKAFKNASSFENHESSKKHRENTERLRQQMQDEDEQYAEESDELPNNEHVEDVDHIDSETEIAAIAADSAEAAGTTTAKKANKKSKKSKKRNTQPHKILDESGSEHELDDVKESIANVNIGGGGGTSDGDKDTWSDDGGGKKKKKAKNKKPAKKVTQQRDAGNTETQQNGDATVQPTPTSRGSNKKGKKAAAAAELAAATSSKLANTTDIDHTCVTCSSSFDSKNKLFTHLKKTNHGVYIPKTTADEKPTTKRK